jgi:selenocysteine-specific elongation factor
VNRLGFTGAVFARPGWQPRITDPEQQASGRVAAAFKQAGWAAPRAEELAATLQMSLERVSRLMRLLEERGVLVRLDRRVVMHRDAVEAGKQVALVLLRRAPSFTTMAFRDALGVSRKYAVPLLDHLDRMRFTVRSGHDRSAGAQAKKLLG